MPRPDTPDEPLLFDLPLDISAERSRPSAAERKRPVAQPAPVRPVAAAPEPDDFMDDVEEDEEETAVAKAPSTGAGSRIAAGAADLLVHAAIAVLLLVGTRMLGVRPVLADWPALGIFLLAFSFLYMVVPLAFWGHTLGMAWAGLVARNQDGEPLTFDQTARRWLGGLLTLGLAGLPLLLTGARRSLTDRLSGSTTYLSRGPV
ncbi:MAG TPA: RDD family protein [Thermoanaerobaculia bacterium]|jgi:uncharacterized RDD family membrane protein YckC|nr:RDD family protein [Thermoanaerobaculia bacterium]